MRPSTSLDLTPRIVRRNRFLLVGFATCATLCTGWAVGMLSNHSPAGPLLLSMDEMRVPSPQSKTTTVDVQGGSSADAPTSMLPDSLVPADQEPPQEINVESNAMYGGSEGDDSIRWFNGRPVKPVRTLTMLTTAYSPDAQSCGEFADGVTASGYSVWTNGMRLVAADTSLLPFGTMISVPGYDDDRVVPVLDRGGAIKGHRLDVLYGSHEEALQWGTQRLEITVWEYADGLPGDFVPRYNSPSAVKN